MEAKTTIIFADDIFIYMSFFSIKTFEFQIKFHWNIFQAIIWTNDHIVYWHIYASLGRNEFRIWIASLCFIHILVIYYTQLQQPAQR